MAVSQERLTELQARYPHLAQLSPSAREQVLRAGVLLRIPAGQLVFDEHQGCQGFPLVCRGEIRVSKLAANGRELPLYRVGVGETCVISSACLLGRDAYTARGVAATDCEILLLPAPTFEALLAEPAFRQGVFNLFAERIADLMQLLNAVAFQRLDQRLAALLLQHGPELHFTHQQLADELGSVREMVSRILRNWVNQGWVQVSREHIRLVDRAALEALAESIRP